MKGNQNGNLFKGDALVRYAANWAANLVVVAASRKLTTRGLFVHGGDVFGQFSGTAAIGRVEMIVFQANLRFKAHAAESRPSLDLCRSV